MSNWLKNLNYDPIESLLESNNFSIIYFTKRDLLDKKVESIQTIWNLPEVNKILKKQQIDGSWKYLGKKANLFPLYHYPLVATFKIYRDLIEKYELDKSHPSCEKASEFILSCQTKKGDIRGMIGNQYATYYTGYITSLLIKAGYLKDARITTALEWLIEMRQDDGGWTIPILTHYFDKKTTHMLTSSNVKPVEPDKSQPFSHNWTNMVLQGFSIHPDYKNRKDIIKAAELLKSRFFKRDVYQSYQSPKYWTRFGFWWPNLLTALKSLHLIGYTVKDETIFLGLKWFLENQEKDGFWNVKFDPKKTIKKSKINDLRRQWLSLKICRLLKNYYL